MTTDPTPAETPRRTAGHWWKLPLGAALALVYALVFGEIFLRLLLPQALVPRYVTGGADGVRANLPDVTFRQWTPEVDVRIHYNRAGQRDDRPPPGPKQPGECRIALLGDSYFVGFESSFANQFGTRLEQALAHAGHPCRTLNFAVSGFGDAEMLRILGSRVRQYQPDVLLVSVHQTDGYDNLRANLYRPGPDGLIATGNSYLPGVAISDRLNHYRIYRWLQENSHIYSALREWAGTTGKKLLATLRTSKSGAAEAIDSGAPPDGRFPDWVGNRQLNGELLLAIQHAGATMGARTLLFEIPTSSSRSRYVGVLQRLIPQGVLQQIPHASPLDSFRRMASPSTQLYLERGQRHWTALGNRVAAAAAADALIRQQLLPQPTSRAASGALPPPE